MKKLIDIEPFHNSYYILNKESYVEYGPFDTLSDTAEQLHYLNPRTVDYHERHNYLSDTYKKNRYDSYGDILENNGIFVVYNDQGYIINSTDVYNAFKIKRRHYGWREDKTKHEREADLVKVKSNPAKIKKKYIHYLTCRRGIYGPPDMYYRNDGLRYFRKVKTFNEIKQLDFLKFDEDIKNVKIKNQNRERRFIPNAWDDLCRTTSIKSWKINSKRKKQWIPKK
jgi:hypothetical protein